MGFQMKIIFIFLLNFISTLVLEPAKGARYGDKSRVKILLGGDQDVVRNLPGQPKVEFKHYAGYVTVNKKNGRALFYWFYEAETAPEDKPLVLWLNGGPGCSSVGYGAIGEIGPFIVDKNGQGLILNSNAWNKEANMLFLESPVGVGFSYTNTNADYSKLGDNITANDAYVFLHNWMLKFPAYKNRKFYIAGESYAGKYVPQLAELILDKNKDPSLYINLKGILIGNPETDDAEDWRGLVDYAWSHAVVSDETHKLIINSCNFYGDPWINKSCSRGVDEVLKQYKSIDMYSLYTPTCTQDSTALQMAKLDVIYSLSSTMLPRIIGGYDPCIDKYATTFFNRADVQKALHVSDDDSSLKNWSICNGTIFKNWEYEMGSAIPIHKKLIAAGLRVWIYSGDTDGRVPVLSTRYSLSTLRLPITTPWRPWYFNKQVAGWTQEYKGLIFATFRGAGHAVPVFKPEESLAFFSLFLRGESPPLKP